MHTTLSVHVPSNPHKVRSSRAKTQSNSNNHSGKLDALYSRGKEKKVPFALPSSPRKCNGGTVKWFLQQKLAISKEMPFQPDLPVKRHSSHLTRNAQTDTYSQPTPGVRFSMHQERFSAGAFLSKRNTGEKKKRKKTSKKAKIFSFFQLFAFFR